MIGEQSADLSLPHPYQVVLDAVVAALREERLTLGTVDPARGVIFASTSINLLSFGENVTVQLGQEPGTDITRITITSELGFGLIDWGRNRRNVNRIVRRLHTLLPPSH